MTSYDDDISHAELHSDRDALMPRTIIDIPLTQLHDLDARCESLGISRAEAVRRAVEGFMRATAADGAFGLWNGTTVEPMAEARARPDGS
jgi:hypothetical protein